MIPARWRWPLVAAGLAAWSLGLHWAMLQASSTAWVQRLCVAQHAGIHALLAWVFGSTLRPGRTALVTQLAERVHRSVTPAMYSITMNAPPSGRLPNSNTCTSPGWPIKFTERASLKKRAIASGSLAYWGSSTLMATCRPSFSSAASYTSPMPPLPSTRKTWYWPIVWPITPVAPLDPASIIPRKPTAMATRPNRQQFREL